MAATKIVFVVVLSAWVVSGSAEEQGRFVEFPRNTTAGLNLGAVFLCRFCGTAATPIVNGIRIENRTDVEVINYNFEPISEVTFDLAIRVNTSEATNNSEIWCQGHEPNVNSSHAWLTVQGLLAAPGNVSAELINATTVNLTWSEPFTLDITNVDPDISNYTVYINNTSTGQNDTKTTVTTSFIFSGLAGEDPSPCHDYSFSVSANNIVGEGERSEEVLQRFGGDCQGGSKTEATPTPAPSTLAVKITVPIVIVVFVIIAIIILYYRWRRYSSRQDDSSKGSIPATNNSLQKNGTSAPPESIRTTSDGVSTDGPHQENGNGTPSGLGGPPPPPVLEWKGVSGQGLRRRHPKDYLRSEPEL